MVRIYDSISFNFVKLNAIFKTNFSGIWIYVPSYHTMHNDMFYDVFVMYILLPPLLSVKLSEPSSLTSTIITSYIRASVVKVHLTLVRIYVCVGWITLCVEENIKLVKILQKVVENNWTAMRLTISYKPTCLRELNSDDLFTTQLIIMKFSEEAGFALYLLPTFFLLLSGKDSAKH